jgi:aubergine
LGAGDREKHWGAVEKCFSDASLQYENVFVVDFHKPKNSQDTAYAVIKQLLAKGGFLSQFVNFNNYSHENPRDMRRSEIILQGVARQILQKTGVRLWWVQIPQSLPTPTVIVGVDVFHAPMRYDPKTKQRVRKASCAAIIVQVFRESGDRSKKVEIYTQAFAREPGKEYELADALKQSISAALKELKVSPTSCIVLRDGIGDSAFDSAAQEEIKGVRAGLLNPNSKNSAVPLAYVVAQKRIAIKFLSKGIAGEPDGKYGAPSGTLVKGAQLMDYNTFYINGRAPPYSTPKPVRYIVIQRDEKLKNVPMETLMWNLSHDYPNWTGPIKVPSVIQMAHKLAELGGSFADCGQTINTKKLKNKLHFL